VSIEQGSQSASLIISGGSLRIGLVLLLGTCVERRELLLIMLRGHTACPGPKKSVSRSANLSKGEMCSNYSLGICP
jgi:hypothetical protein